MESKVSTLSYKISDTVTNNTVHPSYDRQDVSCQREPEYLRAGYAFINSGSYFTKILDSAQEGCVFSIKFKSATKGEFTIISLDKIKSRNGWQEIVEYTGSIEDANSFKVEELGICETSDKETWQVTKKLKIRLLK